MPPMIYTDTANVERVIRAMLPHVGFLKMPEVKSLASDEHEPNHPNARPGASFDVGGFIIDVLDFPAIPHDPVRKRPPSPAHVAFAVSSIVATQGGHMELPVFDIQEIGVFRSLHSLFNALNGRMLADIEMSMAMAMEVELLNASCPQPS